MLLDSLRDFLQDLIHFRPSQMHQADSSSNEFSVLCLIVQHFFDADAEYGGGISLLLQFPENSFLQVGFIQIDVFLSKICRFRIVQSRSI